MAFEATHFTPSAVLWPFVNLLLKWAKSHLSFCLCCIYLLKMLLNFGILIFISFDPVFLLQTSTYEGSAVFQELNGLHYTLFCLILSITAQTWALSSFLTQENWHSESWSNLPKASQPISYKIQIQTPVGLTPWARKHSPEIQHLLLLTMYVLAFCINLSFCLFYKILHPSKPYRSLEVYQADILKTCKGCFEMLPRRCQIWVGACLFIEHHN